ncbi:unnamed protein product, partial [Rotaria sordida]
QYTAVKIAPRYHNAPVIHVLDASKSVVVCGNLPSKDKKDDYLEEIAEEYNDIRDDYYANLKQIRTIPINDARKKRWISENENFNITKPTFLGDDILIFDPQDSTKQISTLFGLRQQTERDSNVYMYLSDFISSTTIDYIGLFALAVFNVEQEAQRLVQKETDDYSSIILKLLGDHLTEAYLLSVKYQGIRPAAGYPTKPDHTEKLTIWKLLNAKESIGIELTKSVAMQPSSAVSELYVAHPESTYFVVGKINEDQVRDYANRKGMSIKEIEKWLSSILAYDVDSQQ